MNIKIIIMSFYDSIWSSDIDGVKKLIKEGADVNSTSDSLDIYPLHQASNLVSGLNPSDNEKIIRLLVDAGADINIRTKKRDSMYNPGGRTPLHMAALSRNADITKLLIELGADVEAVDEKGNTPLDIIDSKTIKVRRILLEKIKSDISEGGCKQDLEASKLDKLHLEEQLTQMRTEVSDMTEKVNTLTQETRTHENTINRLNQNNRNLNDFNRSLEDTKRSLEENNRSLEESKSTLEESRNNLQRTIIEKDNNLSSCITRKDQLQDLLRQSESLLETRNRTIRECEEQKTELEQDVASISARLLMENIELSDDVIEARDRLRLALETAARNSDSVQLGTLVKDMSDFMNSGNMNNYQLSVMESIMEENIRQATAPDRIELLRIIFVKIKDEVIDRDSAIEALKELASNEFKVGMITKIRTHIGLF